MSENVGVFLSPQKNDPEHGPWFVAAVARDTEATSEVLGLDTLPPLWEKKFKEHLLPVELLQDLFKVDALPGIKHIAMLESDYKENDPFYFGRSKITHNSLMCWKHEDGTYRYFHCEKCAASVVIWLAEGQQEWSRPLN